MSLRTLNYKGFGHIGAVMFVLAFAVIGFAGYKVLMAQTPPHHNHGSDVSAVAKDHSVPTVIKTRADLQAVANDLDTTNGQLSSSFDTSALDSDINSLL